MIAAQRCRQTRRALSREQFSAQQHLTRCAAEFTAEGAGEAGRVVEPNCLTNAADGSWAIGALQITIGLAQPALLNNPRYAANRRKAAIKF